MKQHQHYTTFTVELSWTGSNFLIYLGTLITLWLYPFYTVTLGGDCLLA